MIAPALALEPATPQGNALQFVDISRSSRGLQKYPARFESPLKTSFNFHNPRGSFHSSPVDTFVSSPNVSPAVFHTDPSTTYFLHGDRRDAMYSKAMGVPIARSNVKSLPDATPTGRKVSRHHRDLSGTSSSTSSISGPPYNFCMAIDPSALQPPLRKFETETRDSVQTGLVESEVNPIISPFINQVLEQGPDGTTTGRYSRPLTSTGRPSHARKTPPGHVKRPRNAFILFRSHACSSNLIPPTVEKDHRQISRIVSHMWKSLPAEEKVKWEREAEAEKELHRKLHPDYRYKPIYRKENTGKKTSSGSGSSPSNKKKRNLQKKMKGANLKNTERVSKDSGSCATDGKKSPDQLLQERDEEIRCEAVAKVLMETKLTGMTIDEGEMEERVLEQVRRVKENDAIQLLLNSQSLVDCSSDQARPASTRNLNSNDLSVSGNEKPKNKLLAPLQARRKSLLNRSNSAPPPPSPLRTMHVREIVYNPKARGSRELSPDFPKPRLMTTEDDMNIEDITYAQDNVSHPILFPDKFDSQFLSEHAYNPFAVLGSRNPSYHHFQPNSTPSQELEPLFQSPDFGLPDESCFRSQHNDLPHGFFTSQLSDQDDYPIFNGLYTETKPIYHEDTPDQSHWENFGYLNGHFSPDIYDPLTKLTENPKAIEQTHSNAAENQNDRRIGREEKDTSPNGMGNEFLKDLTNVCISRRPSLSLDVFMRRKSSITMALNEGSSPELIEALESAKKNMAIFSDQKERWDKSLGEPTKRRHSVILSGLGEFPIMDLPLGLADQSQRNAMDAMRRECAGNEENFSGSAPEHLSRSNMLHPDLRVSDKSPFNYFIHPFAAGTEMYHDSAINPPSLKTGDVAPDYCDDGASAQYANMASSHVPKDPQVSNEGTSSLPGITFESGIGPDGQTYLFLTKEQAETEGLIAQILDAGFGVTYETDIPQEEG